MFYVSSIKGNLVGIMDTNDNVEEFYSPNQIKEISKQVNIKGVSSKGIKKIDLGEALLTRRIVEKINCKKELSFEVVDDLTKYKLLGNGKIINDDFITLETDTDIKLISDKIIMLGNFERRGLFEDTKFTKINFHNTNTSSVKNMHSMFKYCKATSLDLSSFNTSNVEDMRNMFMCCHATSLDLSSFNTSNVKDISGMFYDCDATSLDLSSFDTSKVKDMRFMFWCCHAKSIDLSSFNTSNVKDMEDMFGNCYATSINLSSFDTSKVKNMNNMFCACQATSLDLSNFNISKVKDMRYMFDNYKSSIKANDSRILEEYNSRRLDV